MTTRVLAGKYELLNVIGRGGTGEVYRARHGQLDKLVAVKVLHPHVVAEPDAIRRFRREARAAARLEHPHVVRVTDFGQDGATFYIVLELVAGNSMGAWLVDHRCPPPLDTVERIASQILEALVAAHAEGIVHRDLKPDNVLVTEATPLHVKVTDFGLAHLDDPDDGPTTLTRRDAVAGTPAYMSPEQCRSLRVTASTDLYALGCLLTELLQLRPPFVAPSPVDVISQQLFVPPPPLARPAGATPVPPLLERLRLDLLAKRPHERPATAADARARLLEAFDERANALALPDRKGNEPLGSRAERTPGWGEASATDETRDGPWAIAIAGPGVELSETTLVGLAAQGLLVHRTSLDRADLRGAKVLVVEVESNADDAAKLLSSLQRAHPGLGVVVAGSELSTQAITRLIESGAADVARHPLTAERLGPKLIRLVRR